MIYRADIRDRAGEAAYNAWTQMHTSLGPWRTLPDWKQENFRIVADAVVDEMEVVVREHRAERDADKAA